MLKLELRDYQEECKRIIESKKSGSYLIRMATGLGKCFAKGTKIRMYDGGIKVVEDIKPGDKVMGWDLRPRHVSSTTSGHEPMVAISRKGYNDYIVNISHILCLIVMDPNGVTDYEGKKYNHLDFINIEVYNYLKCSRQFKNGTMGYAVNIITPNKISTHRIQIKPKEYGEYFGFTLTDNVDRRFLLKDGTVVHNTVTFSSLERKGKVLVLAHREELINQPAQYYDCPVGFEQEKRTSRGEEVVLATVQTLKNRLKKFKPDEFDTIITDECHHAPAPTYRTIYNYFKPRLHLGFTATPNRGDGVRLDDIYEDIIFDRDLRWGITNGYLADIECYRADIGFDLSKVRCRMGDYAQKDLETAMDITKLNKAIAEAYHNYTTGQTLIFATSVKHAYNIAKYIKGAAVVTSHSKDRDVIIEKFKRGKIKVLVNVMVFTEGIDLPNIETVIIARPTQNTSLYTQMVGRGLRLYEGKTKLRLIDCVGESGKHDLCTAPSLLGIDMKLVPKNKRHKVTGDIFSLENIILKESDVPESWIKNMELVNIWAKEQSYDTKDVNWFRLPNGDFICRLPAEKPIVIKAPNELGKTVFEGQTMDMQKAFDRAYEILKTNHSDSQQIWNLSKARVWGSQPATIKQKQYIKQVCPDFKKSRLTRLEASQILNRVFTNTETSSGGFNISFSGSSKSGFRYVPVDDILNNIPPEEYVTIYMYTTGSNPKKDKITRITTMKFRNGNQTNVLDITVNDVSDSTQKNTMDIKDAISKLQGFIGSLPIVGHQVSFATQFLMANGYKPKRNFVIDTMAPVKIIHPQLNDYSLNNLEEIAYPKTVIQTPRYKKLVQTSLLLQNLKNDGIK